MRFGFAVVISAYTLLTIPSAASVARSAAALLQQAPQASPPSNVLGWVDAIGKLGLQGILLIAVVTLWREYLSSRTKGVADTVAAAKLIESIESNTKVTEAAAKSIEKLVILLEKK